MGHPPDTEENMPDLNQALVVPEGRGIYNWR